jgi:hypothetical protein
MIPINGGPVTQAATPDNSTSPPNTLIISSPAVSDVVKMVDAKVDSSVIKAFIQNSTTTFTPSASELIALKNHGVPDEILTAMLQRGAEVRSQIAQSLHRPPPAAPTYASPSTAPSMAPEASYESYPSDYASYGAQYADYSYGYPYGYSYPYNYWWYNYSYPYYSYYWPYYAHYGHYYSHYGHGYYHHHGDGQYHQGWPNNHPAPHSSGTYAGHPNGTGRLNPYAPVGTRPTSLAMGHSPYARVTSAARPRSFGASAGGFHAGGGFSGHTGGGHGMAGGGGHAGGGHR